MMPTHSRAEGLSKSFVRFDEWVADRKVPSLSTNSGATEIAFQRWRKFKEAFAPELVRDAIAETEKATRRPVRRIFDPFGGSGTTALAGQFLGVHATTVEVNPYLADLIEAKLASYDFDEITDAYVQMFSGSTQLRSAQPFPGAPKTFVEPGVDGRFLFSTSVALRLTALLNSIEDNVAKPAIKRLFRVLLVSCAVELSNAVVSGKGRRYRRDWQSRPVFAEDVDRCFSERVQTAFYDIRRFGGRRELGYELLRGDARELSGQIDAVDMAIFSPPYPNSFDYTDVYNIELWVGSYLASSQANTSLRNKTLRSHVQVKRDFSHCKLESTLLEVTLDRLHQQRSQLWNKHIPAMVGSYFQDLDSVVNDTASALPPQGRMYVVVGDSQYAGVTIPVASIIAQLVEQHGLDCVEASPIRSMRASPQQGGQTALPETLLVLAKQSS